MSNLFYLLQCVTMAFVLVAASTANADEAETVVTDAVGTVDAEPAVPAAQPEPAATEDDLVKMVGYLSAQGAGVGLLGMNSEELEALVGGFSAALLGEKSIEDVDPSGVESAMAEARARLEASGSGEETDMPGFSPETPGILGMIIVAQTGLLDFEFNADEVALIREGFREGLADEEMSEEIMAKMPAFQGYMQKEMAEVQSRVAEASARSAGDNKAAGAAFLDGLKANDPEVQSAPSGLHYKILDPGGEILPEMSDSVLVHYRGTLIDGTQFDSSYDRGSPATFPLQGVVPGFGEGLTKIGEGGKIMLYIPSELGYGDSPRPGGLIKPGDTLVFECELLQINP